MRHASSLSNISLAREDGLLHAGHVLASGGDSLGAHKVTVIDDALPRIIALPVFLYQREVLFFLDDVIRALQANLLVALLLHHSEVLLRLGLPLLLGCFFLLLQAIQLEFALLVAFLDLDDLCLLFCGQIIFDLGRSLRG